MNSRSYSRNTLLRRDPYKDEQQGLLQEYQQGSIHDMHLLVGCIQLDAILLDAVSGPVEGIYSRMNCRELLKEVTAGILI